MKARGDAVPLVQPDPRVRPGIRALGEPRIVLAAVAVVSVVAALVAARVGGTSGPWLWNPDLPKIHYPWATLFHEALLSGRLPLWSDRLGLGFPLYAEGQIGAFYPPNWLVFRLPPLVALDVTRVLHLSLAGIGTGLLALRLTGSRAGAVVAAATAVLAGGIVTKLEWTNAVVAYGWLPWVVLPLARRPGPTRWGLVASGIAWGIQALAGFPNLWLLTGVTGAVVLLGTSPRVATVPRVLAWGLLGAAVGAVQLAPTLLLTTLSVRSTGLSMDDLFNSAATPFDVLSFGFANAFVRTDDSGWAAHTNWYPDGIFALLEVGAYVGLPVIALAAVGVRVRRARPILALVAVMIAIPVVAAFRPELWADVPILSSLRSPVRSYLFADFAIALLAAFGVARLGRDVLAARRAALAIAVVVLAYLVIAGVASRLPGTFEGLVRDFSAGYNAGQAPRARELAVGALTMPLPLAAELLLGLTAVVLIAARRREPALVVAVAAVAIAPLLAFSPPANPVRDENAFTSASSSFVGALRSENPRRVLTLAPPGWYAGTPDQLAAAGVPDVDMFSSLNLRSSDELTQALRGSDSRALALRQLVGIDYVVTFGEPCRGTRVAEVPEERAVICRVDTGVRPPLWIPDGTVAAGTDAHANASLQAADAAVDVPAAVARARGTVVREWSTTHARVQLETPEPGWVYFDRAWWPAWETTVDGRPVRTHRALGGQLVSVPAGRHEIAQRLVPWDAFAGLAVGLVAIAIAAAWASGVRRVGWRASVLGTSAQGRRQAP